MIVIFSHQPLPPSPPSPVNARSNVMWWCIVGRVGSSSLCGEVLELEGIIKRILLVAGANDWQYKRRRRWQFANAGQ